MNRQLLVSLIGIGTGVGFAVVAQESSAAPGEDGVLPANPELEAIDDTRDGTADRKSETQETTLEDLLRLRIAIIDARGNGSIKEYIDGPTEGWRDRVSLQRLA